LGEFMLKSMFIKFLNLSTIILVLLLGAGSFSSAYAQPDISVSPTSHNFGNVTEGNSSTPLTVTISNDGDGDLTITSLSITGTDLTEFSIDPDSDTCSGEIIAPAGDCTADITFDPATEGAKSANLSISSDDPNEDPFDVSLLGTGVVPDISADPELLNFVDITVDTSSEPQEVLISNNGEGALEITDISITGLNKDEFSIYSSEECLGVTLLTGESCSVSVVFEPTSEGNKQAKLSIESDDPDENPLKLSLTGRGFVPCGNSPEIKTLSKSKGTYSDTVVIKGSGFCTDQGTVIFAKGTIGVEAEIDGDGWEDTKITVRVPWGCQVGKNKVKVITNYGTESATKPFKFLKPIPHLTGLSIQTGAIGSEVVISGDGFGEEDYGSVIMFGDTEVDFYEWGTDSITVDVPDMFVGKKGRTVSVRVMTRYGTSNSKKFKVLRGQ